MKNYEDMDKWELVNALIEAASRLKFGHGLNVGEQKIVDSILLLSQFMALEN